MLANVSTRDREVSPESLPFCVVESESPPPEMAYVAGYCNAVAAMQHRGAPQLAPHGAATALSAAERSVKIRSRMTLLLPAWGSMKGSRGNGVTRWRAANDFLRGLFQVLALCIYCFAPIFRI